MRSARSMRRSSRAMRSSTLFFAEVLSGLGSKPLRRRSAMPSRIAAVAAHLRLLPSFATISSNFFKTSRSTRMAKNAAFSDIITSLKSASPSLSAPMPSVMHMAKYTRLETPTSRARASHSERWPSVKASAKLTNSPRNAAISLRGFRVRGVAPMQRA